MVLRLLISISKGTIRSTGERLARRLPSGTRVFCLVWALRAVSEDAAHAQVYDLSYLGDVGRKITSSMPVRTTEWVQDHPGQLNRTLIQNIKRRGD